MITKKRKYKKAAKQERLLVGLLTVLDVLIIGFLVFGNLKLYAENKAVNSRYLDLNQELNGVRAKNQELKELFSSVSREEYAERILREKGMYKKAGERVVVINRDNALKTATSAVETETKSASVWDKIVIFFKGIFK